MTRRSVLIILDSTLFVAATVVWSLTLTGLAVHEWLGLAFGTVIVAHIVLQWNWLTAAVRHLRTLGAWRARVNFLLNVTLFVVATLTVYSGIMISRIALPVIGFPASDIPVWYRVHQVFQRLGTVFVGLHIAINWRWITTAASSLYASKPSTGRGAR